MLNHYDILTRLYIVILFPRPDTCLFLYDSLHIFFRCTYIVQCLFFPMIHSPFLMLIIIFDSLISSNVLIIILIHLSNIMLIRFFDTLIEINVYSFSLIHFCHTMFISCPDALLSHKVYFS